MKKIIFALFIALFANTSIAQYKVKDTTTRRANFEITKKANTIQFKPVTPALLQIAGAPKAFYSYFWELGDGNFSKKENPEHKYKQKKEHKVNLQVTNNYDNGKPPATRPKLVTITEIEDNQFTEIANLHDSVQLKLFNTRDAIPDQEMVVVVTYQNPLQYVSNGTLHLFYNDNQFKNDNFELQEIRTHFNETEIKTENSIVSNQNNNTHKNIVSLSFQKSETEKQSDDLEATLLQSKNDFRNSKTFEFNEMNPGETRNVFFQFKTTPQMLKDTSAIIKMRSVFVPDRKYKNHKKKTLEMEIVTSHDPNKMSSNGSLMNYRLVRFKTLKFKTKFQNNGEGPARTIRLETDIPEMFDKTTFKVVNMYPKCPICPKNEEVNYSCLDTILKQKQIHFTFKNIYLPGSNQKNVEEIDSTKGFVQYSLKFTKNFHKVKTKSRTSIFFDKNEPIITNYATTRFLPGISIGIKSGYNLYSKLNNAKSYFIGFTVSPYKSYKWYWQLETATQKLQYNPVSTSTSEIINKQQGLLGQLQTTNIQYKSTNYISEIPALIRYNVNNYIGFGAGLQLNTTWYNETFYTKKTKLFEGPNENFLLKTKLISENNINRKLDINMGYLIDFTAGFARIGPSIGARYIIQKEDYSFWQLYAIWKF